MEFSTEEQNQINLERSRALQDKFQQENQAQQPEEPGIKRMGWGVFIIGFVLILLQVAIVDLSAATFFLYVLGWLLGAILSVLLYFLKRPYKKSMKEASWMMDIILAGNLIPFIDILMDIFPIGVIVWIYVFIKSRSKTIQKIAHKAHLS